VEDFARAREGEINIRTNIFAAESVEESGLVHHEQRLGVRPAEDEMLAAADEAFVEIL
jgi:hypothetical protein